MDGLLQSGLVFVFVAGVFVVGFTGWIWSLAWAVSDARRRGQNGGWVLLLCILVGPAAALVWLVMRPTDTLAERPADSYRDPETALTAASQLEMIGEWEKSAELFRLVGDRWPEHGRYAAASIEAIRRKQSLCLDA